MLGWCGVWMSEIFSALKGFGINQPDLHGFSGDGRTDEEWGGRVNLVIHRERLTLDGCSVALTKLTTCMHGALRAGLEGRRPSVVPCMTRHSPRGLVRH